MHRPLTRLALALALIAVAARAAEPSAPPSSFVGTWSLVSVDNIQPDGTRTRPYGEHPQGILVFDAAGRYAIQIYRAERPRFAANDKSHGTPAEYEAAVNGSNAHFGKFAMDASGRTITFQIEHASYPNWEGTEQKRTFSLEGDVLIYTVPVTTNGTAAVGEVRWQRSR